MRGPGDFIEPIAAFGSIGIGTPVGQGGGHLALGHDGNHRDVEILDKQAGIASGRNRAAVADAARSNRVPDQVAIVGGFAVGEIGV